MTRRGQCPTCGLSLETCQYGGYHPRDVREIATDQILDAVEILGYEADAFLRWPWRVLDELYGGIAPGTVHYVVAFSGMGKTTFIGSAILRWLELGMPIDAHLREAVLAQPAAAGSAQRMPRSVSGGRTIRRPRASSRTANTIAPM